jgi:hypothetical protein
VFDPGDLRSFDEFTRDELAVLGREFLLAGQLMDRAGMPHVISAYNREVMGEIAIAEWMGASPVYTKRMQQLLRFGNGDVETIFKGMQFDIGAPPEFMDFRYTVIDANRGEFWLDHCGALMDVEPMGAEYVTTMCHAIEDPTFDATATATSPYAQVRPIHRPPRIPEGRSPHCHWTVEINEQFDPLPYPELAKRVTATNAASLPIPELAANSVDSSAGWADYSEPLDPDLQLEQFSRTTLLALVNEFCLQSHLLVISLLAAIEDRFGTEAAANIGAKQFIGSAGLTAERLHRAFASGDAISSGGDSAADAAAGLDAIAQVLEVHPAFHPRSYVDFGVSYSVNVSADGGKEGELVLRLGPCLATQESGRESWVTLLADGHDQALQAIVQAVNPFARCTPVTPTEGDLAAWQVVIGDTEADESNEVALTRFSTGAEFEFTSTPVTLSVANPSVP